MKRRLGLVVVMVGAVVGLVFASVSTYDFVAHLDRQVHGIHCSFLPGIVASDVGGSGCQVTLMSPYSSVLRDSVWGGIPISLPAMSVFAFLLFAGAWMWIGDRERDERASALLVVATFVPVVASVVMGAIAIGTLDTVCKTCVGIYVASGLTLIGAVINWLRARRIARGDDDIEPLFAVPWGTAAAAVAVGLVFVSVPVMAYAASAPDFDRYLGACGTLAQPDDPNGVLVPLGAQAPGVPVVEILDPLCPACRGFEHRFSALEAAEKTRRSVLLFPLDDECNWMVDRAIHPGACAISEAILCAEDDPEAVLEWAFAEQERIVEAATADPEAAARMAEQRFPALADCIGSPQIRAQLNLGLRWAVDNQLPVLTPQVYVGETRVCDEDTDLGIDYVLTRLVERVPASPAPRRTERRAAPIELGDAQRRAVQSSESEAEAEVEAEAETEAEAEAEAETEAEGEAVDEAAEIEAARAALAGVAESETEAEAEAETEPEPAAEPEPASEPAEPAPEAAPAMEESP